MAKVSVIIPIYNVEKYVGRCARSLFEQTLYDIEYIFIDDCSPDNSISIIKKILEDYSERKDQVIFHRMENNSGQAKVREWGMKHATGDYIIHCDGDDWPESTQYEKMYKKAILEQADLVFCDFNRIVRNQSYAVHNKCIFNNKYDLIGSMLGGNSTPNNLWACLVKRNLIDDLMYPVGNQGEDKVIMLQFVFFSTKICRLDEALYNYVFNDTSITNTVSVDAVIKKSQNIQVNCNQIIKFLEEKKLIDKYKNQIVEYKLRSKIVLWPQRKNKLVRERWNEVYPEVNVLVFFNRYVSIKEKIIYFIFEFGLWWLV